MNKRFKTFAIAGLVLLVIALISAYGDSDQQQGEGQCAPETLDGRALVEE